ncbi:GAF domain-containing protein [Geodermatophilus sp. SYSU D00691]
MPRQPSSDSALPLADELSAVFARMSGLLLSHESVTTALGLVTSLALETVPGSTGAGVSILDELGRRTSGATDERVEQADVLQYDLDEGPCLAATAMRRVVRVDDLAAEDRWPRWAQAAAGLGLRASLSAPMVAGDRALGAVKVYAERAGAFDRQAEQRLTMFAAQAAILVANVQAHERARRLTDALRQVVRERDVVGIAKGVLMDRHGVDEDTAFGMLLARAAQDAEPLRDSARSVVDSAVRRRR